MEDDRKVRRDRSGFTLVELVVVIAILGVLAGVAYAGYGGYIKYAKRAGDEDLIAAVNAAFASACEDQGIDRTNLYPNYASLSYEGTADPPTILGIESIGDEEKLSAFQDAFDSYYSGNDGSALKYYKRADIKFLDGDDLFTVDQDKIAKQRRQDFQSSNASKNKENLLDSLENIKDLAKRFLGNENYGQALSMLLGSKEDILNMLKEGGIDIPENASEDELADALILYCAQTFSKQDPKTLGDKFLEFNLPDNLENLEMKDLLGLLELSGAPAEDKMTLLTLITGMTASYYNYGQDEEFNALYEEALKPNKTDGNQKGGKQRALELVKAVEAMQDKLREEKNNNTNDGYYGQFYDKDLRGLLAAFSELDQSKDSYTLGEDTMESVFDDILGQLAG